MILYWDETRISTFAENRKVGILRALPANYPRYLTFNANHSYYRCQSNLWWTLLAVPVEIFTKYPLEYFFEQILKKIHDEIDNDEIIWNSHLQCNIIFRAEIVTVSGDLEGRHTLFQLLKGFSTSIKWCHICLGSRDDKKNRTAVLRTTDATKQAGISFVLTNQHITSDY